METYILVVGLPSWEVLDKAGLGELRLMVDQVVVLVEVLVPYL